MTNDIGAMQATQRAKKRQYVGTDFQVEVKKRRRKSALEATKQHPPHSETERGRTA